MADVSSLSMVSSYNSLAMYRQQQQSVSQQSAALAQQQQHQHPQQQHPGGADGQQYWYGYPYAHAHAAHHQATAGTQQYLEPGDVLAWPHPHPHAHPHYPHHLQYQHHQASYQQQPQHPAIAAPGFGDWSGDDTKHGILAGEPSPPITVSGSEISSPGTPSTPPANNNNNVSTTPVRPSQIRSPYEWMKKPSYQSQPNPACSVAASTATSLSSATPHELCSLDALGKTRTKDKYRVVYTDHQRLELEKEFHYSRYITIRRKAELAANLALSERQVKIWFQNRRAKERKQTKKREELDQKDPKGIDGGLSGGGMAGLAALGGMGGMLGNMTSLSLAAPPPSLHPHPHPHPHAHPHPHSHTVLGL